MTHKKLIGIDLDGTLTNFKKIDHEIIDSMFKGKKVIYLIDKISWFVNDFDFLPNTQRILCLRFILYSIFSFKSYNYIYNKYKELYILKTIKELNTIMKLLNEQYSKFEFVIISNNLLLKDFKFDNDIIILFDNSKEKIIKKIIKEKDIFCFIGNNYFNDIYTSYKFNIKSVYVGKSKFVKKLEKVKLSCDNIFEALDILSEEV